LDRHVRSFGHVKKRTVHRYSNAEKLQLRGQNAAK
jgi:hypothetical protein